MNITSTLTTYTTFNRKARLAKQWIRLSEFTAYVNLVVWILSLKDSRLLLSTLIKRVAILWRKSGSNFTFLYLKEALRLSIRSMSGQPDHCRKIMVKTDLHGIPKIIPYRLRRVLIMKNYGGDRNLIVGIFTILSIFRVFPTKVEPDLRTITSPFTGVTRTFDKDLLRSALKDLGITNNIRVGGPSLIGGESSGPNSYKACWGSLLDALAFIKNPRPFVSFLIGRRYWWVLAWFMAILILLGPLYVSISACTGISAIRGRLAVVYDQAGKARVVAVTNWWIQLVLFPLHKSLFKTLKTIREDGTHDQGAPLNNLKFLHRLNKIRRLEQKYHCFDLSAATDRLPIDIQEDILNLLGYDGSAWRELLNINWHYQRTYVKYAVGQPMGAYSSWAMLALTHHVIVKSAALQVGVQNFKEYGVLGDDIVIYNDAVAERYVELMNSLGLEINPYKSISSFDFAEFAKRWEGWEVDISPLGPGLIIQTIRRKALLSALWFEILTRSFYPRVETFYLIRDAPKGYRKHLRTVFGGLVISVLRYSSPKHGNDRSKEWARSWLSEVMGSPGSGHTSYDLREWFRQLCLERLTRARDRAGKECYFLFRGLFNHSMVRNKSFIVFDTIFNFLNPGFWHYLMEINKSYQEALDGIFLLTDLSSWLKYSYSKEWTEVIDDLCDLSKVGDIATIDWKDGKAIKEASSLSWKIRKDLALSQKSLDSIRYMEILWKAKEARKTLKKPVTRKPSRSTWIVGKPVKK